MAPNLPRQLGLRPALAKAYQAYLEIFKSAPIIVERVVDVRSFNLLLLRDRGWEPIFSSFNESRIKEILWEFYANLKSSKECVKCYVRGVHFKLTTRDQISPVSPLVLGLTHSRMKVFELWD